MARGDYLARTKGGTVTPRGGSGNGFWNTVGGVAENIYSGNLADQNVADNQAILDQQIAAAQAGNVTGGDVETYFDPVTKTTKTKLSDRREGMLTGLYSGVNSMGDQIGKMNPYEYADYMYNEASGARNQAQDREKAQVLEMMNARGIDTSTIGNNLFGSTVQSQNFANANERANYISQGQDIRNSIVANQNSAISNIYGNDRVNSQGVADAVSLGTNVAPPSNLAGAYNNQTDAKAATGGGISDILGIAGTAIGGPVGGAIGGMLSKLF
jgi:hypothetical protein